MRGANWHQEAGRSPARRRVANVGTRLSGSRALGSSDDLLVTPKRKSTYAFCQSTQGLRGFPRCPGPAAWLRSDAAAAVGRVKARYGAQVLVDRLQFAIRHLAVDRPRHDLQER
jgi:hypothetical protein